MNRYSPVSEYRMGSVFAGMEKDHGGDWVKLSDAEHYRSELYRLTDAAFALRSVLHLFPKDSYICAAFFDSVEDAAEFSAALASFDASIVALECRQRIEDKPDNQLTWDVRMMQEAGYIADDGNA